MARSSPLDKEAPPTRSRSSAAASRISKNRKAAVESARHRRTVSSVIREVRESLAAREEQLKEFLDENRRLSTLLDTVTADVTTRHVLPSSVVSAAPTTTATEGRSALSRMPRAPGASVTTPASAGAATATPDPSAAPSFLGAAVVLPPPTAQTQEKHLSTLQAFLRGDRKVTMPSTSNDARFCWNTATIARVCQLTQEPVQGVSNVTLPLPAKLLGSRSDGVRGSEVYLKLLNVGTNAAGGPVFDPDELELSARTRGGRERFRFGARDLDEQTQGQKWRRYIAFLQITALAAGREAVLKALDQL